MKNYKTNKNKTDIFVKIEGNGIFAYSPDVERGICGRFDGFDGLKEHLNASAAADPYRICLLLPDDFHTCEIIKLPAMNKKMMQSNVRAQLSALHEEGETYDIKSVYESKNECCYLAGIINSRKLNDVKEQIIKNGFILRRVALSAGCTLAFVRKYLPRMRERTFAAVLTENEEVNVVFALNGKYCGSYILGKNISDCNITEIHNAVNALALASFADIGESGCIGTVFVEGKLGGFFDENRSQNDNAENGITFFAVPDKYRADLHNGVTPDLLYAMESDREQTNAVI